MRAWMILIAAAWSGDKATDGSGDVTGDGDADTDADADTDTDADADADADADTDTDTDADTDVVPFTLSSPDMEPHTAGPCYQQLPQFAECTNFGGENLNPELVWSGVPAGTVSLVLLMDDVVFAPGGNPFDHWVVYDIDPALTGIPARSSGTNPTETFPTGAIQEDDYSGSCSDGNNTYRWRLVALDDFMPEPPNNIADVEDFAITQGHGIALASMCHCPEGDCYYY